jgi:hypothetical protein
VPEPTRSWRPSKDPLAGSYRAGLTAALQATRCALGTLTSLPAGAEHPGIDRGSHPADNRRREGQPP